jgi:glutathione-regulated potassium-efflux system ancillary protein KefG
MGRVLVLFAHPALERSRVQTKMLAALSGVDDVHVRDLYELYPDFDIDVEAEQRALAGSDRVVIQCPFYWYSVPALVKQWLDLVLEHGWAYGSGGEAVRGKWLTLALSTGGGKQAYGDAGLNRRTVAQFLYPLEATARLCGMPWLPPFLVQGAHELEASQIDAEAARYRRVIEALRDDRIDLPRAAAEGELVEPAMGMA